MTPRDYAAGPLGNARPVAETQWSFEGRPGVRFTTEHFDIYTTLGSEPLRDFLPRFVEALYVHFASIVPPPAAPPSPPARMQTYLLETRQQWERFIAARFPDRLTIYRRISAGGFTERNVCAVHRVGNADTLSLLAHESMHQYLNTHFSDPVPAWLHEGLAASVESVDLSADRVRFQPDINALRMNDLREALIAGRTLPLRRLLETDAGEIIGASDTSHARSYYAQVWALLAFVRSDQNARYRSGFDRLVDALRDGTLRIQAQTARVTAARPGDTSYEEAVFLAFIADDLNAFESRFDDYQRRIAWGD